MGRYVPPRKTKILPVGHEPRLVSRHQEESELDLMRGWIASLKPDARRFIVEVFCDSKACRVFSVKLVKRVNNAERLARHLADHLCVSGGHNGVFIYHGNNLIAEVYPEWSGDE